jgi:hypothetical protein
MPKRNCEPTGNGGGTADDAARREIGEYEVGRPQRHEDLHTAGESSVLESSRPPGALPSFIDPPAGQFERATLSR